MARRGDVTAVYAAGLVQGVALVTFPAAAAVFMAPAAYALSGTAYGALFVPQAALSIASSLLGSGLRRRLGTKRLMLLGLLANLLSMGLLVLSRFVMADAALAYGILLASTACLGLGFGFTVPALNTLAAAFFPDKTDRAVLALNALLGLGTALAPLLIALFTGAGAWWGLPVLVGFLLLVLLPFSAAQALDAGTGPGSVPATETSGLLADIPPRFWLFAAFALCYGVCETVNGNWVVPYMSGQLGADAATASLALAVFWAAVTAGRVLFAALEHWVSEAWVCRALPFLAAAAFLALARVPQGEPGLGVLCFGLAGLACSALLPLAISFGQRALPSISASAAGAILAFYEAGYGLAAFGLGPLQSRAHLHLDSLFAGTALVALVLGILAFAVTGKKAASA